MIHDVDKNNRNRSQPEPNRHDMINQAFYQSRGTNSVNYVTPASSTASLLAAKNGQFSIVKSGVWTPDNTLYTTTNPGAGLFASDVFTVHTEPHGLGFTPTVMAFPNSAFFNLQLPYSNVTSTSSSTILWANYSVYVDNTNLYFRINTMSYGTSFQVSTGAIRWYLMQQTSSV